MINVLDLLNFRKISAAIQSACQFRRRKENNSEIFTIILLSVVFLLIHLSQFEFIYVNPYFSIFFYASLIIF